MTKKRGIHPSSYHEWILEEHGNSSVAVWNRVNVADVSLQELNPEMEWTMVVKIRRICIRW